MTDPGQKFYNDYYIDKYIRDYNRRKLTLGAVKQRFYDAGIDCYDAGFGTIGYRFPEGGGSGILFSLLPEDVDGVIKEHGRKLPTPHDPIVLKDIWKRIWNWLVS